MESRSMPMTVHLFTALLWQDIITTVEVQGLARCSYIKMDYEYVYHEFTGIKWRLCEHYVKRRSFYLKGNYVFSKRWDKSSRYTRIVIPAGLCLCLMKARLFWWSLGPSRRGTPANPFHPLIFQNDSSRTNRWKSTWSLSSSPNCLFVCFLTLLHRKTRAATTRF